MAIELLSYADESGMDSSSDPYCLVAGYVGRHESWSKVEAAWEAALRAASVEEFKSHDYFGRDQRGQRVGAFAGWTDAEADSFVDRLLGIVGDHEVLPVGCAVDRAAFLGLAIGQRRALTGGWMTKDARRWRGPGAPNEPYHLAMEELIAGALAELHEIADVRVNFFFDEQERVQYHAIRAYNSVRAHWKREGNPHARKMGFIGYGDSESIPRLQLGDFLAGIWYQTLTSRDSPRLDGMFAIASKGKRLKVHDEVSLATILARYTPEAQARFREVD